MRGWDSFRSGSTQGEEVMSLLWQDDVHGGKMMPPVERHCPLCRNSGDVSLEVERRFFSCSALSR